MQLKVSHKAILLLELIVAIAIMGVVFLFIGRAYGVAKKSLQRSTASLKTVLLLEEKMWELEDKEEVAEGRESGDFPGLGYGWKIDAQGLGDTGINLVTLEVFRQNRHGPESFSVSTYFKNNQR